MLGETRRQRRRGEVPRRRGAAQTGTPCTVAYSVSLLLLPESPVIGHGSYRIQILFRVSKRPLGKVTYSLLCTGPSGEKANYLCRH